MERRKFSREFKLEAVNLVRGRGVSIVQGWLASGDVNGGDEPFIVAGPGLVDERGAPRIPISPYTDGLRLSTLSP